MNLKKSIALAVFACAILACAQMAAMGQTPSNGDIARINVGAGSIKWDIPVSHAGGTLTITFPDGRAFRKEVRANSSAEISLSEKPLANLPDGVYVWELDLAPVLSPTQKEALMRLRGKDDEPESERMSRKRPAIPLLAQAGSFAIINGALVGPGGVEERPSNAKLTALPRAPVPVSMLNRMRNHPVFPGALPDDVIPDDLIVQGSACVGLDCVNGESFSFDTIRMKENNTRISFSDTSSTAGFPTNDWTIRANSSASGGASFLAFVDRGASSTGDETGTIVFEVDAGAPANSLKVASTGRIGLRTATPVLDVHANTSNTPAIRLEQNNSGGFTAQTWDIAGNEANFFVRDVTGGSTLPFRIRPGAPTSSIDISASGNVGIGTASPSNKMDVVTNGSTTALAIKADADRIAQLVFTHGGTDKWFLSSRGTADAPNNRFSVFFNTGAGFSERMTIDSSGNVGINTTAPDQRFSVNGDASKVGGGSWQVFSDERLKNIGGRFSRGLSAVMQLQPLRYEYKRDNALGLVSDGQHVGFSAQELQKIIPEAVTRNQQGYLLVNNDPVIWAMLNAIKEQQKEIAELKSQVKRLQARSRRRNR